MNSQVDVSHGFYTADWTRPYLSVCLTSVLQKGIKAWSSSQEYIVMALSSRPSRGKVLPMARTSCQMTPRSSLTRALDDWYSHLGSTLVVACNILFASGNEGGLARPSYKPERIIRSGRNEAVNLSAVVRESFNTRMIKRDWGKKVFFIFSFFIFYREEKFD